MLLLIVFQTVAVLFTAANRNCDQLDFKTVQPEFICDRRTEESIPESLVCDGLEQCLRGEDENNCLFSGPEISFEYMDFDIERSHTLPDSILEPVRINFPIRDCHAPICFDEVHDPTMIAHLFCLQNSQSSFARFSRIPSESRESALVNMECKGQERSLQECVRDSHITVMSHDCGYILGVSCRPYCVQHIPISWDMRNGPRDQHVYSVHSPGYPEYVLPHMSCEWVITSTDPCGFILKFIDLHISSSEIKGDSVFSGLKRCTDNYVAITGEDGKERKECVFDDDLVHEFRIHDSNFTIQYVSGSWTQNHFRGFNMTFQPIPKPEESNLLKWALIGFFLLLFILIVIVFVLSFRSFTKRVNRRRAMRVSRWVTMNKERSAGLVQTIMELSSHNYPFPKAKEPEPVQKRRDSNGNIVELTAKDSLFCVQCDRAGVTPDLDGCEHIKSMLNYLGKNFFKPIPPPPVAPQKNFTHMVYLDPGFNKPNNISKDSGPYVDISNRSRSIQGSPSPSRDESTGEPMYIKIIANSGDSGSTVPDLSVTFESLLSVTVDSNSDSDGGQCCYTGAGLFDYDNNDIRRARSEILTNLPCPPPIPQLDRHLLQSPMSRRCISNPTIRVSDVDANSSSHHIRLHN